MPARAGRSGRLIAIALAITAIATSAAPANAADAASSVKLTRVAKLGGTTAMASRSGDPSLYVTEQSGLVRAIRGRKLVSRPVLDLRSDTTASGEQGLLGIAFSPDGTHVYVDYTDKSGDTHIDEFAMNGRVADKSTRRNLLVVEQPQPNHNGGQLAFGPDGDLYIALGDGGAANDEGSGHASGGNGQSAAHAPREDPADRSERERRRPVHRPSEQPVRGEAGRSPGDLGVRTPQPLAILVRRGHRRPLDRRRRAERVGRGRRCTREQRPRRRTRRQLRVEPARRHTRVPRQRARRRGASRVRAVARRWRVLGDRGLRVPRDRDPRTHRQVRVHRLLRRLVENPHAVGRRHVPRPRISTSTSTTCRASAKAPIASSTSSPSPAASSSSSPS